MCWRYVRVVCIVMLRFYITCYGKEQSDRFLWWLMFTIVLKLCLYLSEAILYRIQLRQFDIVFIKTFNLAVNQHNFILLDKY